jgi:hypothetical protein
MNNYNFWESWENITEIEQKAIEAITKARELILQAIPKDALVAIYIKGSFVRREMKKGSDVDIVPIITEDKYQGAVFGTNMPEVQPCCVVPLSVEEFKDNRLHTKSERNPDLRAEPNLFLLKLDEYGLIYGTPLEQDQYPTRTAEEIVQSERTKIKDGYIKYYRNGEIPFDPLLKEVFWLVEWEQKAKGIDIQHSFVSIAHSIQDQNHIIYDALALRDDPQKDKEQFISKLEQYVSN